MPPIDIDFKRIEDIRILFRRCTPKVLVVTDGLSFSTTVGSGLTEFVQTLRNSTIHGMTPIVITAIHNPSTAAPIAYNATTQHIDNFKLDDPTHGIVKSRYDVVFLLGINRTGDQAVPPGGINAISKFMQQGGGVFATGDHEDLGMALCGAVPRVRAMRYWAFSDTPNAASVTRLSTNLSGDDGTEEFNDQSDAHPQRLYLNFRTNAGGIGNPHPLLQRPGMPVDGRAIEVFPDHPHEGECRIPSNLGTTFTVDGASVQEWPGGLAPEIVALSMSHGDGFGVPRKQPLVPRSFIAVAAYDGHRQRVGRVVTDATWHHFVNINLDGTGSGLPALKNPDGTDSPALQRIRQYYRNLATWLMPRNVRRCLWPAVLAAELKAFPLFEELRLPELERASAADLLDTGGQVRAALAKRLTPAEVDAMVDDALASAVGDKRAATLRSLEERTGRDIAAQAGLVAAGALTAGFVQKLAEAKAVEELDPHGWLDRGIQEIAEKSVRKHLDQARADLRKVDAAIAEVSEQPSSVD